MPIAFYEILALATRGDCEKIVPLMQSVIEVTQRQADSLARLPYTIDEAEATIEQLNALFEPPALRDRDAA